MGTSRYPRSGHRIAPALLREVLSVSLPRRLVQENHRRIALYELDESAWVRFGFQTCCELASSVVGRVASELASGQLYICDQYLPKPQGRLVLEDLELEARTYNCLSRLRKQRHLIQAEDWASLAIEDLLGISGFGARSLVDFLSSYETAIAFSPVMQSFSFTHDQLIMQENQVLRSWCRNPQCSVSPEILNLHIPKPEEGASLESLGLKNRTYKRLRQAGYAKNPKELGDATVGQLLSIRGFGITSLLDLVAALSRPPTPRDVLTIRAEHRGGLPDDEILRLWCKRPIFPISEKVRSCSLPRPPDGFRLEDLPLNERIYNCLAKQGFAARPLDLGDLKVADIAEVWGMGEKAIVELLDCLLRLSSSGNAEALESTCSPEPNLPTGRGLLSLEATFARLTTFQQNTHGIRNSRLAMRYFGLDGNGGCTLQTAGDEYGVTKERVRQISFKTAQRLSMANQSIPVLEAALEFVTKSVPKSAEEIESDLATQGYSARPFRLEGLMQAAKLFSREIPFTIQVMDGRRIAVKTEGLELANSARRIAIKSIRHWGVVTVSDIAAQLEEQMTSPVDVSVLIAILSNQKGFSWLDKSTGWFWLRHLTKNRLVSKVKKILSVAHHIDVSELRTGVGRHHQMRGLAPPRRVLLELCKQLTGCEVDGNMVSAFTGFVWTKALRGVERTMVEILKDYGPIMQRAEFEEMCVNRGINRSTFYVHLDYSPIIEKYANGVYGLRGACVPPGLVESLLPKHQRHATVRLDHGWTHDGRIFVGYRLSKAMLTTGCFGVPGALKEFLEGDYQLTAADGQNIGKVVIKKNAGWGIGPFFTRRGGEEGDVLLLLFDLTRRVAVASIGDDGLLDQSADKEGPAAAAIRLR